MENNTTMEKTTVVRNRYVITKDGIRKCAREINTLYYERKC